MPPTDTGRRVTSSELQPWDSCPADRHGNDEPTYLAGCRCPAAREAHRIGRGRRHLRLLTRGPALIAPTGTVRRLRALAVIGYSVDDIAAATGSSPSYIGQLRNTTRPIHRNTAAKVRKFFLANSEIPGPSPHAIPYARRRGWLAPAWYDDDTIDDPAYDPTTVSGDRRIVDRVNVNRATAGHPVTLTRPERLEAVRQLHDRRLSYRLIAERLRTSTRQVHRDLSDLGLVAVAS